MAPQSARAHAEEVRRRRALLTLEQRRDSAYDVDSPYWACWFAIEHEEARRRGVRDVSHGSPPARVFVRDEDLEAEAAYQAAVLQESEEEERRSEEEEEAAAYEERMADATALSAASDYVVLPLTPPSLANGAGADLHRALLLG